LLLNVLFILLIIIMKDVLSLMKMFMKSFMEIVCLLVLNVLLMI